MCQICKERRAEEAIVAVPYRILEEPLQVRWVSNSEQRRLPHKLPVVGRRLAAKLNLAGSYVPVKSFDEIVGPGLAFGISPRIRAPHRFRPPRAFPVVTVRSPYRSASTTFIG